MKIKTALFIFIMLCTGIFSMSSAVYAEQPLVLHKVFNDNSVISEWTVAKTAYEKGLVYAYRARRQKKRNFRSLWITRINAGVREYDMSYSVFMGKLKQKNINLDRKVLADLAMNHPTTFKAIVEAVKN